MSPSNRQFEYMNYTTGKSKRRAAYTDNTRNNIPCIDALDIMP